MLRRPYDSASKSEQFEALRQNPPQRQSSWTWWIAAACVYAALAPLGSQPHLLGKLRWVAGGAVGMQLIDWLDLAFHGLPLLVFAGWLLWRWWRS